MALLPSFDTPASLRDAPAGSPFYTTWSNFIAAELFPVSPGNNGAFYDPTETNVDVVGEKTLTWIGFPRDVLLPANRDNKPAAYAAADADVDFRDPQNEYFEWYVWRNGAGKITKLAFVTETPEYYQRLWSTDPNLVVNLYKTLVDPAVVQADLQTGGGAYNKFNPWNTVDGIVHYIQNINTLTAAFGLAQGAVIATPPFNDNFEARPFGSNALTAVDPRVSFDVHMLVRKGLYVTFRDPIGLYIVDWNDSGFTKPDGTPVGNYWRIVRGSPGMVLRLEYEVPAGLGFVVGDIRIGGHPIAYGGQVAEHITVSTRGTAGSLA